MSADLPHGELAEGDRAPDFTCPATGGDWAGDNVRLSDFQGRKLVLFFYPKASTPGCTIEARDFTRLLPEFHDAGGVVLGVSKDSLRKLDNFIAKEALAVTLLSDQEGDMCERYGVWAEKKNYGKTYMGIVRSTFLIDGEGRIARIWRNVKVNGHAEAVLDALRAL